MAIVTVSLGAKGVIEVELISSGEKWGRGPAKDIHSSLKAMVDSPAWHLVKALDTLVSEDGNEIAIDNYPKPRPLSAEEKKMIADASKTRSEEQTKKQLSVQHWINDLPWEQANERLESQPTVNIEGLVGGYTGPGGKTVLPHQAVAKLDLRLVPDMKAADALRGAEGAPGEARLRRHRSEHERRLRSDDDAGECAVDSGASLGVETRRHRSDDVAVECRFVSGLRFHGRAAQSRIRTFRSRSRQRGACAG